MSLEIADERGRTYSLEEVVKLKDEDWFSRWVALASVCNQHIVDTSLERLEQLRQTGTQHQLIAVACSINHARQISSLYRERGFTAEVIHSKQREDEQAAILAALRNGTLDCIITDHAPHTDYEKDKEFDYAPNCIIGLETSLAVTLDVLVRQNKFKLSHVIDLMTRKPAAILGLPAGTLAVGAAGDVCLLDPAWKWRYDAKAGFSKSSNCSDSTCPVIAIRSRKSLAGLRA